MDRSNQGLLPGTRSAEAVHPAPHSGIAAVHPAPHPGTVVPGLRAVAYGGDYNPEQWPEEIWREDVALMREAGVNLVSLGIFSWALLEPAEGRFDFDRLDRILDLLHGGGILVDLATPTAAPPAWFLRQYPEARLVDQDGRILGGGTRQSFCPSSPAYARASARIAERLADRYAGHPAVVLWHVHNEYGGANARCYCPTSAEAFRGWLRARYSDLGAVNDAWGTTFWGQRYGDWTEVDVPRTAPGAANPAQELDFLRFCCDAHLANFRRERDILHSLTPGVPVTTNFMITNCKTIDYWHWASEVDVVANDHYLCAERPDNHIELAMAADLTRSVAGGGAWLLMEHSTSAVNWQPRNLAKRPGEMRRNSVAHIARGADGALFFQWRAARFGVEKYHSAMVPHGGANSRIFREVVSLGADLRRLDELRGTSVVADVGIVWDWESWWALELDSRPSVDLRYLDRVSAYYTQLWRDDLTADFAHPEWPLDRYPLVVVPSLYLTTPAAAENLRRYVERGGVLVVSYFSGIVDATDTVHPGGYPGALRDLLGLSVEEFLPLRAGETMGLTWADASGGADEPRERSAGIVADVWAEDLVPRGAATMLRYIGGPADGGPAVTRHAYGRGLAWYVSTRLEGESLAGVLRRAYRDADIRPRLDAERAPWLELVRRTGGGRSYLIAINHGDGTASVAGGGHELLTDTPCPDRLSVPGGEVRVLRLGG